MTDHKAHLPALSSWYVEGLRWIGTLFHKAADRLERPSIAPAPLEPHPEFMPPDYRVFQLRHRIQTLYF